MELKISGKLNAILRYAQEEAVRTGSPSIETDHLVLGILRDRDNPACSALESLGINLDEYKNYLDSLDMRPEGIPFSAASEVRPSRRTGNIMNLAAMEAIRRSVDIVDAEHLLMAVLQGADSNASNFLIENGIDRRKLEGSIFSDMKPAVKPVKTTTAAPEKVYHIAVQRPKICS